MGHVQWVMGQLCCGSLGHGSQVVTHCLLWLYLVQCCSACSLCTFLPPLPLLLLNWCPLNQLEGLGSDVSSPVGSGAEPRLKTNFVHSNAVRKLLVAIILDILSVMFHNRTIKS